MKPLRVILAEDDDIDVMAVERALREAGTYELRVASDGEAVLELLRGPDRPDPGYLLVLDINMPRVRGFEVLEELERWPALAPAETIIYSTSPDRRDRERARALGVRTYLCKDDDDALVRLVQALEAWRTPRAPG